MKKLSKRVISLILAAIMAMPMLVALPSTATAAAGDGKILEWNFLGSSKPSISSPTPSVNDSYDQTVSSTHGSATLNLHNWSTGDRHFHYDNDTEGMKSTDGVASLRNLSSYLADGKDIDIQFTMAVNANTTASNKGVFAIGSYFDDYNTTENNANDLVYLSNTGDIRYRSTSSNTDIRVSGASTSVTQNSYFNYRIYFTYSSHKIDIYRNNILIGTVTNAEIDKNDFVCLVIGAHIPNNFGNFAIKKLTISQYASSEQADFSNFSAESTVASSSIKAFNGTAYIYSSAATGGYTTGTVVHHTTGNTDSSGKQNKAYMDQYYYTPKNLVLAYDGTKTLKFPVVFAQKQDGKHKQRIYNVAFISGTNMTMEANWKGYTDVNGSYSVTNAPWPGLSGGTQISYVDNNSSYIEPGNTGTFRAYGNYIKYTGKVNNNNDGSVNTSANYFEKLGSIGYRYKGYKDNWGTATETLNVTISGYSVYIINYKPIYDILKSSTPTTVNVNGDKNIRDLRTYLLTGDGSWMYTNASRAEALRRINAVGEVDPNAYGYNSDASTDVALCAAEIKNAYEKFVDIPNILVKNTFTITYDMLGTDKSATVVAGNDIDHKASGDAIPSLTGVSYVSDNKHHSYTWSSTGTNVGSTDAPSGTHVPHSNETYKENDNLVACSLTASQHYDATADTHGNGYTCPKCSVCGHVDTASKSYDTQDFSTYNSAMDAYNGIVNASDYAAKYTSASRTDYEGAVSSARIVTSDQTLSPTAITNAASAVTAAQSYLVIQSYTISFVKADETTVTTSKNYGTSAADVGTAAPALPANYFDDTYHYSYAWDIAFGIVTGTATYTQQKATAAHIFDNGTHTAATTDVHGNGYTVYTCDCGKSYTTYDAQDFTAYNSALVDYGTTYAEGNYTTSSKADYKTAVEAAEINTADVTLSPKAISDATTAIGNAKSTLDPLADLTYFDATYDKANTFLVNLDKKAAEYTADSMQTLLNAMNATNVATYADANAAAKADYGQTVQTSANSLADNINSAMAGLKTVETVATGVDTSTLEAAIVKLNNIDPDAYDVESGDLDYARNAANAVISSDATQKNYNSATINVLNGNITQQNVEDATNAILNALTVSTKTYTVSKDAEGDTSFGISSRNGSYKDGKASYGATIVCDSSDAETAWYLEIQTGSMHKKMAFQYYGQRLTTKVLGTTTIKAIKKASTQNRVKILRKYDYEAVTDKSPVQFVDYVDSGASFTLPAAPAIAFYSFDSYYIGETPYAAGASVTISDDTEIIARYTASEGASCAINATALTNGTGFSGSVAYNTKIELEGGDNAYAWVETTDSTGLHYRPFYIGSDVSFFATETTTLKAVTKEEFDTSYNFILPAVNLRKSGVELVNGKTTFNAQIVPNGATVQEYGILIAAPSSKQPGSSTPVEPVTDIDPTNVVIENSGQQVGYAVLRAKSTKLVGANQFTISVNSIPSGYVYRGYLIYADADGTLHNVYSEAMR